MKERKINMFYVVNKKPNSIFEQVTGDRLPPQKVYAVQYKKGYPFFLLYENGQWITKSAKYYIPTSK
jgi:hypothetical protein